MATIQVRDLSEETYEVLRKRARREGKSLQSYLQDLLDKEASRTPKAEVLAAMQEALDHDTGRGVTLESILNAKDADRR